MESEPIPQPSANNILEIETFPGDPFIAVMPSAISCADETAEIDISHRVRLSAALESLLIVADQPLDTVALATIVGRPIHVVGLELERLAAEYTHEERGFALRSVAGGWRFYSSEQCRSLVERYVLDGQQSRLTQAALETLAVVAYRQPVSRGRISAVRGVNVDGVVRTLMTRGLIQELSRDAESGAVLYGTTMFFLERLGIVSLDELPPVADFLPDLDSLGDLDGNA